MQLKELFTDDDAVSPVIGVILMVAITVILAAVIGTFVLGLGQQVQKTAPTASLSFDQQGSSPNAEVTVSHDGGDPLKTDDISFTLDGDGDDSLGSSLVSTWDSDGNSEITAGESVSVTDSDGTTDGFDTGDTIKVVWTADGGESSSVLGEYEVQ